MTVGQDLLKMETGEEATGSKKAGGQTPKSPAADDQPTSSHPKAPNESDTGGRDEKSQHFPPSPQTPKESSKTDIKQDEQTKTNTKGPVNSDSKISGGQSSFANREERRVFYHQLIPFSEMS